MKAPSTKLNNRAVTAFVMLLMTLVYSVYTIAAQTSGLPAPTVTALNTTTAQALVANLTGCTTTGNFFQGSTGTCIAPTGTMTWPSSAGIAVYGGSQTWGSSLAAPSGTIVGTTDTQTLTNKTIDGVTAATMAFLDATSSIQTQLNAKISAGANSTLTSLTGLTTPVYEVASSETVTFSATPTFATTTRYSTITMTAAITTFTLGTGVSGQEKTLTFCGAFGVTPPTNVHGFMTVANAAGKCSSQHFNYDVAQTAWLSDGPGTVNM